MTVLTNFFGVNFWVDVSARCHPEQFALKLAIVSNDNGPATTLGSGSSNILNGSVRADYTWIQYETTFTLLDSSHHICLLSDRLLPMNNANSALQRHRYRHVYLSHCGGRCRQKGHLQYFFSRRINGYTR